MSYNKTFYLEKKAQTGSDWEAFSFAQLASKIPHHGKPYKIDVLNYLFSLFRLVHKHIGMKKGILLFFKVLFFDLIVKKPSWDKSKFDIKSTAQEKFYRKKFKENLPVIVFYNALTKLIGKDKSDRLIADSMVPLVLEMMKSKYHPVDTIESVEVWLRQARNYLGNEIEKGNGFEGTIYLAQDKSELRFHVTRCAPMQILREYGLVYTASALCMCDHITYHSVFPNLIFKRSHTLAIGDTFCDHEIRLRTNHDPIHNEDCYSDCAKNPELRQFVKDWEEMEKKRTN